MKRAIIKIADAFYLPFVQRFIPRQTFRYAVTGGANMMFDALLYFIFFQFILDKRSLDLGFVVLSPEIAPSILVFPIIFFTGLWLAKNVTFQNSPLKDSTQRIRYLMVVIANIGIKLGGIKTLVLIGFYPSIANVSMTVVTVMFSYVMQNVFTFRGHKLDE